VTEEQKDAHARIYKWAAANKDILLPTGRYIGGLPSKGEIYGYGHFNEENHGFIGMRNPHIERRQITIKLDETSDMPGSDAFPPPQDSVALAPSCPSTRTALQRPLR